MTGWINYTPEADKQLNELDDWITKAASAEVARRFVSAILDHIDGILVFPSPVECATTSDRACGRAPSRRRPSSPTRWMSRPMSSCSTSSASSTVAGTGRPRSARTRASRRRSIDPFLRGSAWQEDKRRPSAANGHQRVSAGQPHKANDDREQPLSVPRIPWFY